MKSSINLQTLGVEISESIFFCGPWICIVSTLEQHFMNHWAVSDSGACIRKLFLGALWWEKNLKLKELTIQRSKKRVKKALLVLGPWMMMTLLDLIEKSWEREPVVVLVGRRLQTSTSLKVTAWRTRDGKAPPLRRSWTRWCLFTSMMGWSNPNFHLGPHKLQWN